MKNKNAASSRGGLIQRMLLTPYSVWALLLKHNPVSRVAVFSFLNPVCGVVISAIVLHEGKQIDRFYPEVVHIFSCAARKAFWSTREPTYEIYSLKKIASNSGFFSHGEFLREKGHLNQHNVTLVMAGMREGEPHVNSRHFSQLLDEKASSKLPLAARMATFIQEASKDLENMNQKLQQMNERLQKPSDK